MKTTKEMIEVMQAFEDGKQIQVFYKGVWTDWVLGAPLWNWTQADYRVKPEPKEPTYRPYESIGEMLCDYNKRVCRNNNRPKNTMPLVWVRNKKFGYKFLIIAFDELKDLVFVAGYWENLIDLFTNCVYFDGTPCGRLVEE